jgi:hypothetical protein
MGFYPVWLNKIKVKLVAAWYVLKIEFSMQCHIHMHMISTYFNIEDVEKISYATWKRALKQTSIVECNLVLKPSCGGLEISTSRKEKFTHRAQRRQYSDALVENATTKQQPKANADVKTDASAKSLRRR